jgi:uncharacterized damage-inducible protein DinB
MDPRIAPLSDVLRLNTTLFRNCLKDVTEEQAARRPSSSTNSIAFVAAHVTDSRFDLLKLLGAEQPNSLAVFLEGARGLDEIKTLPPLAEIERAWSTASRALRDRLGGLSSAEIEATIACPFPLPNPTPLGVTTFYAQHDSYHIGQLALLRKFVGLPAMSYA